MYYQIEGRLNMKTLTFDEEGLTVGKQTYPIDDIENLKITNAPLFATYGILTFHSGDRDISVAFPRSAIDKLRRAIHDFEHEQMMRKKAARRLKKPLRKNPPHRLRKLSERQPGRMRLNSLWRVRGSLSVPWIPMRKSRSSRNCWIWAS